MVLQIFKDEVFFLAYEPLTGLALIFNGKLK